MMKRIKNLIVCGIIIIGFIKTEAQTSFEWAVGSLGSGDSQISIAKMKTDSAGNIYTYGQFSGSILLDPINQTGQITSTDDYNYDLFFCKRDTAGNVLLSFTLAGNTNDTPADFDFDEEGNIWLGGHFYGVLDVDPGIEEYLLTSVGNSDLFLAKYNPEGILLWAGQWGSVSYDVGGHIAIDSSGNVHFGGNFDRPIDLDPGPGVYEVDPVGYNAFICTLDTEGNFIKAGLFESPEYISITALETDAEGNLWCGGLSGGLADFDPGEGVFILGSSGYRYCFLVKTDIQGNFITALVYGHCESIGIESLAFDSQGSLLITGSFKVNADFDPGPEEYSLNAAGLFDCYVLSLNKDGVFNWVAHVGGPGMENGYDIATDMYDNIYVTGFFYDVIDADPGEGIFLMQSAGLNDGFMLKLGNEGNFIWAKQLRSTSSVHGHCILVLEDGSILETGIFNYLADFDPGLPIFYLPVSGMIEMFLRKLNNDLSVDIPGISLSPAIQIYPNPNNGFFFVEISTPSVCRIFNASGSLVFQSNLNIGTSQLNLSDLNPGLYTVQTISSAQVVVKKMLIL
ncbi:MAG: hypothetical protein CVT94_17330 [Bacteroidetes bacterium HGW-Bacteroidetes-11]|jgi:hypothetical protein|nr:MAG: hypothetical protein CVT94_17330 [Bacteroidetes bacterium HGW-Bacteroidetes-11]